MFRALPLRGWDFETRPDFQPLGFTLSVTDESTSTSSTPSSQDDGNDNSDGDNGGETTRSHNKEAGGIRVAVVLVARKGPAVAVFDLISITPTPTTSNRDNETNNNNSNSNSDGDNKSDGDGSHRFDESESVVTVSQLRANVTDLLPSLALRLVAVADAQSHPKQLRNLNGVAFLDRDTFVATYVCLVTHILPRLLHY